MNAGSYAEKCTERCLERLRDVGERTLSNVGFSVSGESAVAFGALLMDTADEIERLNRCLSQEQSRLAAAVKVLDALDALTDPEGLIPGLAEGPERNELESALAEARAIP